MNDLTEILQKATKAVTVEYFHLQLDGGNPVYRERVYCYELYHQMRLRWPVNSEFFLNGEVDKAAHPILRRLGADRIKPDFLVHQPGCMAGNYAVIEVKSSDARPNEIRKDLINLTTFISTVGYRRAIYLIYGYSANERKIAQVLSIAERIENLAPIELWIHGTVNLEATHRHTLGDNLTN